MLPRNHPDRIQITFDDRRLVANAGCSFRPPWPCASACPNTGDKMMTLVASALAGGDCIDDEMCCAPGDGLHPGRHGQGALHPGHLPAQLPVGPRPSTRPGEPPVAGPGLAGRCRTRRRAHDH